MRKFFYLLLFCALAAPVFSEETPAPPKENRFLFVVETSALMNRSTRAAEKVLRELIESGVNGEMRPGDTFGLWTFGETLNATYPMQRWSPGDKAKLAQAAGNFLRKQRFEKQARLHAVLPAIYSVTKSSYHITVILITTGTESVRGTPFDRAINAIYRQSFRDLLEAKLPFVTVLVGHEGKPVAYSVSSAIGPIQIPQPPVRHEAPQKTNVVHSATNKTAVAKKPVKKVESAPEPAATAKNTKPALTVSNNVPALATNALKPIDAPRVAFSATNAETPEKSGTVEKAKTQQPAISNPASDKTNLVSAAKTNAATPEALAASPDTSAKPENQQPPASVIAPLPTSAIPQTNLAEPTEIPAEVVAEAQPAVRPKALLLASAALLLVAAILIFLFVRHSRKNQPSLISRSINRDR